MNEYSHNGSIDMADTLLARLRSDIPDENIEAQLQTRMRQNWRAMCDEPEVVGWSAQLVQTTRRHFVAACSVVAALLVFPLLLYTLFSSQSVYAQVLAGIRNAQAVYAKGIRVADGKQVEMAEIWYDADRGVREDLGKVLRIDNGEFEWVYRSDAGTAIKGPTRDPIGVISEMLDPVKAIDRYDGKRTKELDATLDGILCRAFVVSPSSNARMRMVAWLDVRNRLVRFEEQLRSDKGEWDLDERIDMQYDLAIPDERFAAVFPPETRIIDRTVPLEGFALEDAIATAERLGIVLAIHEVRRVDEDTVLVISTSRASQEVIDRFGKIDTRHHGGKVYGEFMWGTNGRRLADHSWRDGMQIVRLADWQKDGVDYQWTLLRNVTSWLNDNNQLPAGFHVHTRNEWEEWRKQANKPTYLWNEPDVLSLEIPTKVEGLDVILNDVHSQTLAMGDTTRQGTPRLQLKSVPWTKEEIEEAVVAGRSREEAEAMMHGRQSRPEDITVEDWLVEVLTVIAEQGS